MGKKTAVIKAVSKTTGQFVGVDPSTGINKEPGLAKLVSSLCVSPKLRGDEAEGSHKGREVESTLGGSFQCEAAPIPDLLSCVLSS